ncbi:helix-turn-helix transcriptional regulator [Saccharothrix xinjiangensis]|uniref:HTH luxR-type domain-containing protein n=1 Tax=Saccharothrix xinjiangensis TaxID=204798 RepID=A0ABV9XXD6_9PSEU
MTDLDSPVAPFSRRSEPSPSPELATMRFHVDRLADLLHRFQGADVADDPVEEVVARLIRQAARRSPEVWTNYATFPLPDGLREFQRLQVALLEGNRRARVVVARDLAVEDVFGGRALPDVEFRVHGSALPTMTLVDDRVALVAAAGGLAVVRDRAVVGVVRALARAVWEDAADLRAVRRAELAWPEDSASRRVLELLCAGYTDEVAARRMGMSVRTYRRHVADLMTGLAARSRFHAGVLATRLGLVRDHATAASSASIAAE